MPGNPVEVGTGVDDTDDTTVSTSASFAGTVGNVFLVFVAADASGDELGEVTLSHAGVSSWTGIRKIHDFDTEFLMAFIGEVDAATSDALDVTLTDPGNRKHVRVYEISDALTTVVDSGSDANGVVAAGDRTCTLDNAPSDSANLLVAAAFLSGNTGAITSDDYTDFGDLNSGSSTTEVSYKNQVSDSDIVYTFASGGHQLSLLIELEGAAATGPVAQVITTGV